jgi:hypothetical protein
LGFELASDDNGLALRKLDRPLRERTVVRLTIHPRAGMPSNGFLAFGKEPTDAATVKCGLLVGGHRVSVFHGAYGAESSQESVPLVAGRPYDVEVAIDVTKRTVSLSAAGKSVTRPLPHDIDEIRYVGYYVVRTRGHFSPLDIATPDP